jgi:hypothetical protein
MDIISNIKIDLNVADTEALLAEAMVKLFKSKFGQDIPTESVSVHLDAGFDSGMYDRGPGSPIATGATITIKQPSLMK